MYGLVNRAIEQLVISTKGPDGWRRVRERAGVVDEGFIAVQSYPDDVTYRLVAAVSEELGMPADKVLEAFGEYWILYTAEQGYGELLRTGGGNLMEFLGSLDEMHGRVETSFPHLEVPHFEVRPRGEHSFDLHYESRREGLAPMVVGLVRGLAKRFGQEVTIEHVQRRSAAVPQDRFRIDVVGR